MQVIKDHEIDFSEWEVVESSDTGDGLRITIYEKEGETSVMNLDWDEGSRWDFLDGEAVAEAMNRLMNELFGEEEAKELMKDVKVVSAEELEEVGALVGEGVVDEVLGLKRGCSGGCGDVDPGK